MALASDRPVTRWPCCVVVLHPRGGGRARLIKAEEQRLIQQLIHVILAPGEDGVGGEFSSSVGDNHARLPLRSVMASSSRHAAA